MIFKILINQREHNLKLYQKEAVISGLALVCSVLLFVSHIFRQETSNVFSVLKSLCIFPLMTIPLSIDLVFKPLKMSSGKAEEKNFTLSLGLICGFFGTGTKQKA